ncbi:hypothetical protein VTN77DRAFT_2021 [Rasamsonia byssochlamydoides]|uniref:uncharacterized protein n=1 Tax=Rasamsonia byssochlamydoides TaxID=89139 RepID=UPI0037424C20
MGVLKGLEITLDTLRLYPLGAYMRSWNKMFTSRCSDNNTNKQRNWIKAYQTQECKGELLLQRAAYLKEEVEALHKAAAASQEELTPEQVQQLRAWENELTQLPQLYWLHRQELADLQARKPKGAWIREFDLLRRRKRHHWKKDRGYCQLRGGCCDRDCGCCERPRKTFWPGKVAAEKKQTHCSVACGCCVRTRGFYEADPNIKKAFKEW